MKQAGKDQRSSALAGGAAERAEPRDAPLRLLAVGDLGAVGPLVEAMDLRVVRFAELTADELEQSAPDVVLAPLVGADFDCFDLAALLVEAGFRGRFRAAAMRIPDPGLVRREVRSAFPELDFDLLVLDPAGRPVLN